MAEEQWLSASTDLSPKKKKSITQKILIIPQRDPSRQHNPATALLKRLTSEIKSLFTSKQRLALYRTAPDRTTPPWLQNYQQNHKLSPLYRLPPEIVFLIVKNTDRVTRHVMRRTCKLFMAIIGDGDIREFEAQRRGKPIGSAAPWNCPPWALHEDGLTWDRFVWPVHEPPLGRKGKDQLANLLARDRGKKCDTCYEFQKSGQAERILWRFRHPAWCSGCEKKHPLIFFSAKQRAASPSRRVCIGREGKLRLFSHEAMTWDEIHQAITSTMPPTTVARNLDEDHWQGRDNATLRSCRDKSHHSPEAYWPLLGEERFILPRIVVRSDLPSSDGKTRYIIYINWTSPVFDLDPNAPIRKEDLRDHLVSQEQESYLFEHALCPHVTLKDEQLLLAFEPNQCVCFEHPPRSELAETSSSPDTGPISMSNKDDPPSKPLVHNCKEDQWSDICCKCLAAKGQFHKREIPRQGHFMRPEEYDHYGSIIKTVDKKTQCDRDPWMASHVLTCSRPCRAIYTWFQSGRHDRRVFLQLERRFTMPESMTSMEWLARIDPDSWGLSEDLELRHVVWCDEGGCETRYRWRALFRALAPHTDEGRKKLRDDHPSRMMAALIPLEQVD